MKVEPTTLPDVLLIEPAVYRDERGSFIETFRDERYAKHGITGPFVQDSLSLSHRGVLRGLHLQWPRAQGKLVYVVQGEVFDVAVDVRQDSPTFRRWVGHTLSGDDGRQMWIPPGFAHGFVVTSEKALFAYKCTEAYDPGGEVAIRWNDPEVAIDWPVDDPVLSPRDAAAPLLRDTDPSRLPPR